MAKQPRPLAGKVVAITGAGRGIGRATAAALAAKGARIAVADLDGAAAEQAAAALGGDHLGLAVDVTDAAALTRFLDEAERRLGPLDVLVNNAGIMPVTPLAEEDDASVTRQLELNLHAVIRGTQEAMRRMVPRGTGHIVNVASLAGRSGFPNLATYCATKHGVVGLSEAVRGELGGTGVEISVVMPGIVRTELSAGLKDARGVKTLAPEDVAAEIVSALEVPRFDVFVPRSTGPLIAVTGALPRRLREGIARALGADDTAGKADRSVRAAYEARAARSAPAAEEQASERSAA
jgi:NAD(P)-dependent dehydrogenase (short-subunit alcohol dehydrogenase family)